MLNVGLTQKLSDITGHLTNYPFVLKMLVANFVVSPLLMIAALYFAPFDPALKADLQPVRRRAVPHQADADGET